MPIVISALLSWFGSLGAKFLTDSLLKFAAYKLLVFTLLTVTFPIIIKNLMTWLFGVLTSAVGTIDMGNMTSVVIQFTGFSAYLAQQLHLVDCISILLTALAIRFALNFIPFIG